MNLMMANSGLLDESVAGTFQGSPEREGRLRDVQHYAENPNKQLETEEYDEDQEIKETVSEKTANTQANASKQPVKEKRYLGMKQRTAVFVVGGLILIGGVLYYRHAQKKKLNGTI